MHSSHNTTKIKSIVQMFLILEKTERGRAKKTTLPQKYICMEILLLIEFEMVDRDEPP